MEISRLCIRKDGRMKFWLLLVAFSVIYLLFRLPWIDCDPGIPSIWEYGYNATDEGYSFLEERRNLSGTTLSICRETRRSPTDSPLERIG